MKRISQKKDRKEKLISLLQEGEKSAIVKNFNRQQVLKEIHKKHLSIIH